MPPSLSQHPSTPPADRSGTMTCLNRWPGERSSGHRGRQGCRVTQRIPPASVARRESIAPGRKEQQVTTRGRTTRKDSAQADGAPAQGQESESTSSALLRVQRTAGNRALCALLGRGKGATASLPVAIQRQPERPPGPGKTPGKVSPETPAQRALRLAKLLAQLTPDPQALAELKGLPDAERDSLELAAAKLPRKDATLVRRALSFVRFWSVHKPLAHKPGGALTTQGTAVKQAGAAVAGGTVEVRTGATLGSNGGYVLTYSTKAPASVGDAQWLQFVREIVVERGVRAGRPASSAPMEAKLGRAFGATSRCSNTGSRRSRGAELEHRHLRTDLAVLRGGDRHGRKDGHDPEDVRPAEPGHNERSQAIRQHHEPTGSGNQPLPRDGLPRQGHERCLPGRDRPPWPFTKPNVFPPPEATASGKIVNQSRPSTAPGSEAVPRPRLPARRRDRRHEDWARSASPQESSMEAGSGKKSDSGPISGAIGGREPDRVGPGQCSAADTGRQRREGRNCRVPVLNFAAKLKEGGEGTSRFVDQRKFLVRLLVSERGPLPRSRHPRARRLGRDEAFALMTIRHEMEQARTLSSRSNGCSGGAPSGRVRTSGRGSATQKLSPQVDALIGHARRRARASTELWPTSRD